MIKRIQSWTEIKDNKNIFLTPDDWYERGHNIVGRSMREDIHEVPIITSGIFVWTPPPAVFNFVAIEELQKACIKRHDRTHIKLVPRLMTPL